MPSCRASACSYCKRLIVDPVNALERDSSVKPDTGNPSVRFDEGGGGRETCPSATLPVKISRLSLTESNNRGLNVAVEFGFHPALVLRSSLDVKDGVLGDDEPRFTDRAVKSVTFQGKLDLPIHRWYRLTPSFSPRLAHDIADYFGLAPRIASWIRSAEWAQFPSA